MITKRDALWSPVEIDDAPKGSSRVEISASVPCRTSVSFISLLGFQQGASHVPARAVSSPQESARTQQGDTGRRRIHSDGGVLHSERRGHVPRTRCRLLRASRQS